MNDVLKKNERWHWSSHCQDAFEKLKVVIASESVLKLHDFSVPFEVHADAFDKAVGRVLV